MPLIIRSRRYDSQFWKELLGKTGGKTDEAKIMKELGVWVMIPLSLRLSGFISYLDPVELDFRGFDVACISGSNGAGKSSLLDAITWALFGVARKKDDSLIHSKANAAEVTFDFIYEGNTYRIQRSKTRDKPTTLEFLIFQEWHWRGIRRLETIHREGHSRNRGMPFSTRLHMDFDTFTNASFFLQGKADVFAQQRPADRKRILSSILGLDVVGAISGTRVRKAERP